MVEGDGFEPSKAVPADLQSDPFGHSGTPPGYFILGNVFPTHYSSVSHNLLNGLSTQNSHKKKYGGGGRIRTIEGSASRFTV